MARGDADAEDAGDRPGGHAEMADARLQQLLRTDSVTAYPALRELRARHGESALAYARLCTAGESAARQLAAEAFTVVAREAARGAEPAMPWRHRLLLLTARLAAERAADDRSAGLDPGLLLVLNSTGPGGPVPPLLAAFRSLPRSTQGVLWYAVVEREDDARTATLLGVSPGEVTHGADAALQALGRACLRARLAASDDPQCRRFGRLIEESVRTFTGRRSPDLDAHRAVCPHCATAYEELAALRDAPATALAEGLLPWAGTAYALSGRHGDAVPERPAWPPSRRRYALASAALGVALAPLLAFLLTPGADDTRNAASAAGTASLPAAPPPVTVTATATVSATAATATPSPSRSPRPTRTPVPAPEPTRSPAPSSTPETARPPGGAYAQVVNAGSGLCLDIRDGVLEKGTDVVTAPCAAFARTQLWRVDADRGVLQSAADPDYCLDSRGSVDRGVGIWTCSSVAGRNGRNLLFAVDGDGVLRPGIAPDHAVTPAGGAGLALRPEDGRTDQRWRAGSGPRSGS
ncbi:ricin-type beta-trefoil lectin domain protein [Streptomyces sp. NPDC001595]|uniref:RICIN domain-containing protein n=1 Tax=Streptomyces sp. NPDC001532 TaxID=3154520 RepID=UPI00332FEBD1